MLFSHTSEERGVHMHPIRNALSSPLGIAIEVGVYLFIAVVVSAWLYRRDDQKSVFDQLGLGTSCICGLLWFVVLPFMGFAWLVKKVSRLG